MQELNQNEIENVAGGEYQDSSFFGYLAYKFTGYINGQKFD